MEGGRAEAHLVTEAVETAAASLSAGERVVPLLITDRSGDLGVEQFPDGGLTGAKAGFAEFVRTAAGDESCALVYVGPTADHEDAIVIERGEPGRLEADVFVQRFRPKRGPLRGFKLIGKPRSVGATESVT